MTVCHEVLDGTVWPGEIAVGYPDLSGFCDLFDDTSGDLARTLSIIDGVGDWWVKHIINIAAYVNRDDPDMVELICGQLEEHWRVPPGYDGQHDAPGHDDVCAGYIDDCRLGGLGRSIY